MVILTYQTLTGKQFLLHPVHLLQQLFVTSYLSQLVTFTTRKDNILDLVLTTHPELISSISSCDNLRGTDHDAIIFSVTTVSPSPSTNPRFLYNYNSIDLTHFNSIFSSIPWNIIDHGNDIELSWSMWKDLFLSAIDSTIHKTKWKSRKVKHWFSPSTINLIYKKRKLYRSMCKQPTPANKLRYRTVSNLVRTLTRSDTKKRALNLSQTPTVKKFWSWVNSVKRHRTCLPPLQLDATVVTDDCTKANMFNNYFYSVFTNEDTTHLKALENSLTFLSSIIHSVNFTSEGVYYELVNLDVSKACGPDHITPKLLKLSADFISDPLSRLFNQSMSSGTLPKDWTTANIVPVYKKGERCLVQNYQPISLTSVVVKVMERVICKQLVSALEKSGRISDYQFGFRANRSTVTLLLSAMNDWSSCLERRSTTHCVLLDFAKAFDSVPHEHLLLKLHCLGITGQLLHWLRSFLTCRFQRVTINSNYSDWLPVRSGVPQGSVLGPLLFLLYVDDLPSVVSYSTLKLFADDVALYREVTSPADCLLLQKDLDSIYYWTLKWQLRLNASKCLAFFISNKKKLISFTYKIHNTLIAWNSIVKYLGVHIKSNLSWSYHCKIVSAKAKRTLKFLRHSLWGATTTAN